MSWRETTLGEITDLKRGFDLPKSQRLQGDVPVYSSSGITGSNSTAAVEGPCVITGRYGTIGEVFFSGGPCWPLNTALYSTEFNGNNPRFVYYLLQTIPWQGYTTASAVPGVNRNHVNLCPVKIPDRATQDAIVEVLDSIVDKIALNNRLNDYLEQCLLARYDHLFRGAGTYNGTISDIGDVVGGATPSKKRPEYYCHEGIGWITPKDLSNTTNKFVAHGADDITRVGFDSCSIKKLPAGTVLFSSRAPIGYIAIASDEVTTNQGFKSIVPHKEIGTAFVYCFLVRNKDRIADAGSGTTFPEVSGKTMAGIELTLPNINLCAKFEEWASPLLEEQRHLEDENRQLEDLRDTLLPKLMSGEIDVSKVDLTQLTNNHLADC
ncbi:restriction endonuclease subunit S [Bifidobacterium pseudocatenulatum]|uniref:restriction endonuclease subunit S n=2 Tax=Bifidobacterium pseudocatenulatum TaxID=28026 RepID=UPI001383DB2E|nr:restriction endonuclease subunit S [Bifidobacterium pseudocatenulatum]MCB4895852.1 restriction endonuclease subunit S [Bifidobacterium pseudocatenulatum]MDB6503119.1 restriction endonuclease subunit S [Bifidobacterium pseudocatenulatum]MDB6530803.1 restriction endonuclease subunit S [Bifidobacterium pseudocatenulatum]MZM89117.1 restriction endonuclease subunit S [Bifidobacterium pseudocatenulatum]MZM92069.1 restriction endonuclease subunit S [Bifidobacterium pseudocatenulatum]